MSRVKTRGTDRLQAQPRATLKRNASVPPDGHGYRGSAHSRGLSQQEPLPSSPGPRLDVDGSSPLCIPQALTQLGLEDVRAALTETGKVRAARAAVVSWPPCWPLSSREGKRNLGADLLPETFWLRVASAQKKVSFVGSQSS